MNEELRQRCRNLTRMANHMPARPSLRMVGDSLGLLLTEQCNEVVGQVTANFRLEIHKLQLWWQSKMKEEVDMMGTMMKSILENERQKVVKTVLNELSQPNLQARVQQNMRLARQIHVNRANRFGRPGGSKPQSSSPNTASNQDVMIINDNQRSQNMAITTSTPGTVSSGVRMNAASQRSPSLPGARAPVHSGIRAPAPAHSPQAGPPGARSMASGAGSIVRPPPLVPSWPQPTDPITAASATSLPPLHPIPSSSANGPMRSRAPYRDWRSSARGPYPLGPRQRMPYISNVHSLSAVPVGAGPAGPPPGIGGPPPGIGGPPPGIGGPLPGIGGPPPGISGPPPGMYACTGCGAQLPSVQHLAEHENVCEAKQREEKPFKCRLCSKTFRTQAVYNNHMRHHAGGSQSFGCKVCGQRFNNVNILKMHMSRMHPSAAAPSTASSQPMPSAASAGVPSTSMSNNERVAGPTTEQHHNLPSISPSGNANAHSASVETGDGTSHERPLPSQSVIEVLQTDHASHSGHSTPLQDGSAASQITATRDGSVPSDFFVSNQGSTDGITPPAPHPQLSSPDTSSRPASHSMEDSRSVPTVLSQLTDLPANSNVINSADNQLVASTEANADMQSRASPVVSQSYSSGENIANSVADNSAVRCFMCSRSFETKETLTEHLENFHVSLGDNQVDGGAGVPDADVGVGNTHSVLDNWPPVKLLIKKEGPNMASHPVVPDNTATPLTPDDKSGSEAASDDGSVKKKCVVILERLGKDSPNENAGEGVAIGSIVQATTDDATNSTPNQESAANLSSIDFQSMLAETADESMDTSNSMRIPSNTTNIPNFNA